MLEIVPYSENGQTIYTEQLQFSGLFASIRLALIRNTYYFFYYLFIPYAEFTTTFERISR